MNNFPGSSTYFGNGLTRTCRPNLSGPEPGHCVAHYTDCAIAKRTLSHFHNARNIPEHRRLPNLCHQRQVAVVREAREKKEKQERERRELAMQSVQAQEVAAQCRKTAEVSRLDEQGKDHPFSQQIIAQREDIDNALDPEHAAHLWLNHATVLLHEAEHQVTHWRHRIKVNQESKLALCLLPEIDVERMTRAIDDLTNSEIIHHDRLLQRDRARFIYDAAQKKRAQVRQDLQIGGNDEGRKAL